MYFLLALLRFSLCAWVGAATLFVVTGIREVTSPLFAPLVKNQLAALRFPAYYAVGFVLVGVAFFCAVGLRNRLQPKSRGRIIIILLAVVVALMLGDWIFVFNPLLDLMNHPDAREMPEFASYHQWSKYLNLASLSLCFVSAILALRETRFDNIATSEKSSRISG